MYILAKRYDPVTYVPLFMDMRRAVLEIMYSFIHIVPERLKHTYGIRPYEVIEKNIRDFTALSRTMSVILGAFAKDNGAVLPDSYFDAYEPSRENVLP
jgi:hypothetical protein